MEINDYANKIFITIDFGILFNVWSLIFKEIITNPNN